jgi:hypothetical protein
MAEGRGQATAGRDGVGEVRQNAGADEAFAIRTIALVIMLAKAFAYGQA